MMNLSMFGGGIVPTPSGGDDVGVMEGIYSGKKHDDLEIEERLKRIKQDEEDVVLIVAQFIVENHSN